MIQLPECGSSPVKTEPPQIGLLLFLTMVHETTEQEVSDNTSPRTNCAALDAQQLLAMGSQRSPPRAGTRRLCSDCCLLFLHAMDREISPTQRRLSSQLPFGAPGGFQKPVVSEKEPSRRFWEKLRYSSTTHIFSSQQERKSHEDPKNKNLFDSHFRCKSHCGLQEKSLLDSQPNEDDLNAKPPGTIYGSGDAHEHDVVYQDHVSAYFFTPSTVTSESSAGPLFPLH